MLTTSVERYISLRRTLGYGLLQTNRLLLAFAQFSELRGETHLRASSAAAWATEASTPGTRYVRLRTVIMLARFLHAEDPAHEIPQANPFPAPHGRLMPYIYSAEELSRIILAAGKLPRTYPLRRETYAALFGLIASTGLRISEALNLRLTDVHPDGVLFIRRGKGGKSRLVPLHPTAVEALDAYLQQRSKLPVENDHLFLSASFHRIGRSMADYTFRRMAVHAGLNQTGTRPCRIHDLRHTFATRSLELACGLRVSELVELPLQAVSLHHPPSIRVRGKGRKERCLPLWKETAADLRAWLTVRGTLRVPELFVNAAGASMTRAGFEYVLNKHVLAASKRLPDLKGRSVSPHQLRHSCAVIMLQATRDVRPRPPQRWRRA